MSLPSMAPLNRPGPVRHLPQRLPTSTPYNRQPAPSTNIHRHSNNNYPRLLPPPVPNANLCASYPLTLLSRITAVLRGTNEFDIPSEVNLSFIALCNYNLVHLVGQDEMDKIHARLETTPRDEIVKLARTVQLGISDFLARGGVRQYQDHPTISSAAGPLAQGSGSVNSAGSLPQGSGSVITPRSQTLVARTLERDSSACIITGEKSGFNEVAHIFPYSIGRECTAASLSSTKPNLHTFLQLFAGEKITTKLEAYLLNPITSRTGTIWSNINRLENMMTLSPMLSRMWDACAVTLTPVGDPLSTLTDGGALEGYDVLFELLPRHKRDKYLDLSEVGGDSAGVRMLESEDQGINDAFFYDRRQGRRLVSGMVIKLETRDARKWPLPHPDLLRLHGAIARVVRCAGASGERNSEMEFEEEGEEDEGWGRNEVIGAPRSEDGEESLVAPWVIKGKEGCQMGFAMRRFIEDKDEPEWKVRNKK
ncbi:hypothetical protein L211DRAFT_868103 [Terfezia boudieri ATCC MYA-4762]|uniref:HNH nuclease domain-containing protein n=1 Tax=Terfezia boudieri ATCC MYA-4762 TaxID=1051890 RepID=A0A3N4LS40_9PEZI|nr:hypothetical protein L211DRAFT_868103 [Terfezia boudieri ATCC MYA-4762]